MAEDANIPGEPYTDPKVYDVLHAPETAGEVRLLRRVAAKLECDRAAPVWLEPACGSGRLLRAAARYGVRGYGFDISAPMIEYARACAAKVGAKKAAKKAAKAGAKANAGAAAIKAPKFFVADMRGFEAAAEREFGKALPRADLAFNLINTIRHLGDDRAMLDHFEAVARVLKPGAAYVVGISLCSYGNEFESEDVWTGSRGGLRVTQTVQYLPASGGRGARAERVISHMTVIDQHARIGEASERHIDETYALRAYDLKQWNELIAKSAMRVAATFDGDGKPIEPSEPGYVLYGLVGK
jgi:SAM-dependent methyltransferase